MVTKSPVAAIRNRKVCVWLYRSCFRDNSRVVDTCHRNFAHDRCWPGTVISWRRCVMCDRRWWRRQLHRVKHRNDFSVLVLQTSIISIDAHHPPDNEEHHIGCGGNENERTATFEFACVGSRLNQVIKHLFSLAGAVRVAGAYSITLDPERAR